MRLFHRFSRVLALVALLAPAAALADTYDSATLVAIAPPSKDDVQVLYDNHIDIVGLRDGVYRALVTDEQLHRLEAKGFGIQILYAEMEEDRARWSEARASYAFAAGYYTPSKFMMTNPPAGSLMEHLLQQYNAHPDVTRLYNLGASQDGAYDIIAMKVSKNPDAVEAEPKIRLYANIHGDEQGGVMVTCDVLDTILAGYTSVPQDPTAKRLVDETEMWFIPIGNPYGNAHFTRYNITGKDLNRNFWGPAGSDAPPAWSEKETQVIRDLTEAATSDHSKKRFAVSLSFHEGAAVFNSVWNYTTSAPTDEPIFWSSRTGGTGCRGQTIPNCPTLAPHGLAQAYYDGCTMPGFWYTEGYDWYGTKGDTNDWAYGYWGQLDTTIELNTTKTPAPAQIPIYTAQHRQAVINYMMKVFQGIHGVMTDQATGAPLDGTVTVTATASSTIPVPHVYQMIYTDPVAGDFHRVLQPGTYTVVCSAPGYMTTTITGVVVNADTKTIANCAMVGLTSLKYASSAFTDSCAAGGAYSGDGILDAGEDAVLPVSLSNAGAGAATSVQGALSTAANGITVTTGSASFADIPAFGTGASIAPHFRFSVDPGIACGTLIPFNVHMTAAQGAWDDSFTVGVGQATTGTTQTLFSESFDATTFPPTGWAQVDTSGTAGNWARSTSTVHPTGGGTHSGAGLAYFNSYTSASGSQTRLYRTVAATIPASAATAQLTFWMYHDANSSGTNDRIQVQASTNGASWTSLGSAISRNDGTTGWRQHAISLNSYIGQGGVLVGLLGISVFGYDCHVDDVQLTYTLPSTCTMHVCSAPPSADLATSAVAPPSAATNATVSYSLGVTNNGPGAATSVQLQTATPAQTTFVSMSAPAGWSCTTPAVGAAGPVVCTAASLASTASAGFTLVVKLGWCAGNGTAVGVVATASSASSDANLANNTATASTTAIDNGSCDDGNACTQSDSCQAGSCVGSNPVTCVASDQCHVTGTCDLQSGACSNPIATNGTACDDGNACTTGDACGGGSCNPGAPVACNDSNPCTTDSCDPASGCVFTNNTSPCDDGNACTQADTCQLGACVGTAIAAPGEVPNVRFLASTSMSWDPPVGDGPAVSYDVARGVLGQWPAGAGLSEVCEQQDAASQAAPAAVPDSDTGFWYLVRGRSACGVGSYGVASDGTPRSVSSCP